MLSTTPLRAVCKKSNKARIEASRGVMASLPANPAVSRLAVQDLDSTIYYSTRSLLPTQPCRSPCRLWLLICTSTAPSKKSGHQNNSKEVMHRSHTSKHETLMGGGAAEVAPQITLHSILLHRFIMSRFTYVN